MLAAESAPLLTTNSAATLLVAGCASYKAPSWRLPTEGAALLTTDSASIPDRRVHVLQFA